MSDELKPCPFCHGTKFETFEGSSYVPASVVCQNDDCGAIIEAPGLDEAKERWNRRPAPEPSDAEDDKMLAWQKGEPAPSDVERATALAAKQLTITGREPLIADIAALLSTVRAEATAAERERWTRTPQSAFEAILLLPPAIRGAK